MKKFDTDFSAKIKKNLQRYRGNLKGFGEQLEMPLKGSVIPPTPLIPSPSIPIGNMPAFAPGGSVPIPTFPPAPLVFTWNPDDKGDRIVLSNGNLTTGFSSGGSEGTVRCTVGTDSGKWYWEIAVEVLDFYANIFIGVGNSEALLDDMLGNDGTDNGWSYNGRGRYYHQVITDDTADSYAAGDVIGIALDMDNGKIWWSKNGVWQTSGDPGAGTNEAYSNLSGTIYPMITPGFDEGDQTTANFGATAFSYSVPSGFAAFNEITV